MKPLILLDIDGVLNPLTTTAQGGEDPALILSNQKLALVRRLSFCGRVAWVSTWPGRLTSAMESQLKLSVEPLRVTLVLRPNDSLEATPKLRSVRRWLARMEALEQMDWDSVVWIDDVLGPDAKEWARGHSQPVLLKKPVAADGLTSAHVEAVEAFTHGNAPQWP
jgi:hypothetical protein